MIVCIWRFQGIKHFNCSFSFNPYISPVRQMLFYYHPRFTDQEHEAQGSTNLSKITHPVEVSCQSCLKAEQLFLTTTLQCFPLKCAVWLVELNHTMPIGGFQVLRSCRLHTNEPWEIQGFAPNIADVQQRKYKMCLLGFQLALPMDIISVLNINEHLLMVYNVLQAVS